MHDERPWGDRRDRRGRVQTLTSVQASHDARRAARNTTIRLIADVVGKLGMLALFAVMARELGPSGFGDFALAVSIAYLLTALVEAGVDSIVTREVAKNPAAIREVLWEALAVKLVLGPAAVVVAAIIGLAGDFDTALRLTLPLLAASAFFELLTSSIYAVFRGLGDISPEAVARTLQSASRAVIGIGLLIAGGGIVAVAFAYVVASLTALIWAARRLAVAVHPAWLRPSVAATVALAAASLPVAIGGGLDLAMPSLTVVILAAMKGSDAVGLFGAASGLVGGTLFVGGALLVSVMPLLARANLPGDHSLAAVYEATSKVLVAVLVPLGAAFTLFAEPITRLIFGSAFVPASSVLRIVGATVVLHAISELSVDTLVARDRQGLIPWIAGVTTLEHIALTLALVPAHSFDGAATATLISTLTYAVLTTAATLRLTGRVSLQRILLAPALGALAMSFVALASGTLAALAIAGCVYAVVVLALERRFYPEDLAWAASTLRR